MSKVSDARNYLIDLESAQTEDKELLASIRADLDRTLQQVNNLETNVQARQKAILDARRELERAERLAAAQERLEEVEDDVARLSAYFARLAADKPWYTGTGTDDAILPHQWQGAQFGAVAKRWILGDGVGLGKTRQAIGWLDLIGAQRVLIVAERNICGQFAGEVMEYAPHRTVVNLTRRTREKRHELLDKLLSMDEAVAVINFEAWRQDKDTLAKLLKWHIDTVIVDEAHNLKRTSTANFKNIKTLVAVDNTCPKCYGHIYGLYEKVNNRKTPKPCPKCGWEVSKKGVEVEGVTFKNLLDKELSSKSVKNLCLTTGTPILNTPEDLYSLLHLCNPILFRSLAQFKEDYLILNYHRNKWEFRTGGVERLRPFIEHMFLARKPQDAGVVLPTQHVVTIPIDLDKNAYPKQHRTIEQITKAAEIILDSGESMTIMHLISLITRKRQANVWPGGIVMRDSEDNIIFDAGTEIRESIKMDVIQDMIEDHRGERQVVFSQFKTALAEFERRLIVAGYRVVRFDGDTPEGLRERVKSNFDRRKGEEPKWDIVLANYKTGGTGLNFTAATVTHIMDEEWNPGKRDQAYGRTQRLGQSEESVVYVYRLAKSIDTWMSNLIRHKERVVQGFEGAMMNPNELRIDLKKAMLTGEIM